MKIVNSVAEFHRGFNHPILETPEIPTEDRVELRLKLIQEELEETSVAAKNGDIVEVADGLADILYVVSGMILEFGLGECIDEVFKQVHESNMSKTCKSLQHANEEIAKWSERGEEVYCQKACSNCTYYILRRVSDDKIMKPSTYKPVDLSWVKDFKK